MEVDVAGMPAWRTPREEFYRIDTALAVPRVDPADWRLRIHGLVDTETEIDLAQLLDMPMVEAHVTLTCVSNRIGGDLVGNATWLGVPVRDLLARVGVAAHADMVLSTSVDGFTAGTPLRALTDDRNALVESLDGVEPPPELWERIEAGLGPQGTSGVVGGTKPPTDTGAGPGTSPVVPLSARRPRRHRVVGLAAGCVLAVVIGVGLFIGTSGSGNPGGSGTGEDGVPVAEHTPGPAVTGTPAPDLRALQSAPDAESVSTPVEGGDLVLLWSKAQDTAVVLVPAGSGPPEGMGLQVWTGPGPDDMDSDGMVVDGTTHVLEEIPAPGIHVMVTVEPMAGSAEPTGDMVGEVVMP
ncbi:molybdopterin-dependent oxidoreductase [Brevibacterium litoralis]|uniref:molybdopterin-dependent oxidoreductase n=1 Tax=Brevibacterium litoralis TaxID=3138935 RepID=UPI0032EB52F1